jgi:hypothetical protein
VTVFSVDLDFLNCVGLWVIRGLIILGDPSDRATNFLIGLISKQMALVAQTYDFGLVRLYL